jgi:hypothetical protein
MLGNFANWDFSNISSRNKPKVLSIQASKLIIQLRRKNDFASEHPRSQMKASKPGK